MSKVSIKKLMILALIMVGAIACFSMDKIVSSVMTWGNAQQVQDDEYLDVGLEYKDGWYLINDEQDYYTMCNNLNSNIGQGLNYKLMNNIEVDYRAGINVMSGSLDGNGYTITRTNDPQYVPMVNSSDSLEFEDIFTNSEIYFKRDDNKVTEEDIDGYAMYGCSAYYWLYDMGGDSVYDGEGQADYGDYTYTPVENYYSFAFDHIPLYSDVNGSAVFDHIAFPNISIAIGGVIGVAKNAQISNLYVRYAGRLTMDVAPDSTQSCFLGGIVGFGYESTISNCIIKSETVSDFLQFDNTYGGFSYTIRGGIAGSGYKLTLENNIIINDDHWSNYGTELFNKEGGILGWCAYNSDNTIIITRDDADQGDYIIGKFSTKGTSNSASLVATTWEEYVTKANAPFVCIPDCQPGYVENGAFKPYDWAPKGRVIQRCFVTLPVKINFNLNGGTYNNSTAKVKKNGILGETYDLITVKKTGYSFNGWYKYGTDTKISNNSKIVWDHLKLVKETDDSGEVVNSYYAVDLIARWSEIPCTVTAKLPQSEKFNTPLPGGWSFVDGTNNKEAKLYVYKGKTISKPTEDSSSDLPTVTKNGYEHTGWSTNKNGKGDTITKSTEITESITIYPIFTPKQYTATFDFAGGKEIIASWPVGNTSETVIYTINDTFNFLSWKIDNYPSNNYLERPLAIGEGYKQETLPECYQLKCWKIGSAVGNWASGDYLPGASMSGKYGDITIKAVWGLSTITFDLNGGTLIENSSSYFTDEKTDAETGKKYYTREYDYYKAVNLPRSSMLNGGEGVELVGWELAEERGNWTIAETDEGTGIFGEGTPIINKYGDIKLKAVWKHVVYADANGGKIVNGGGEWTLDGTDKARKDITSGESLGWTPYAERDGYKLTEWFYFPDGLDNQDTKYKVGVNTVIGSNVENKELPLGATIYAVWEPYTYYVIYDGNVADNDGAMDSDSSVAHVYGEDWTLPTNEFTREGYDFKGWALTKSATVEDICLEDGEEVTDQLCPTTDDEEITLYAVWGEKDKCTINAYYYYGEVLAENGWTINSETCLQKTVFLGEEIGELPELTGDGEFLGWFDRVDNRVDSDYSVDNNTMITITAKWKISATLTFYGNGGTYTEGGIEYNSYTQSYTTNERFTLTPNKFINGNETFIGWSIFENATSAMFTNGAEITLNESFRNGCTLYAVWDLVEYIVWLDPNGGEMPDDLISGWQKVMNSDMWSRNYYNNEVLSELPVPTKIGTDVYGNTVEYMFAGWCTAENGYGTYIDENTTIKTSVTAYAIWKEYFMVTLQNIVASDIQTANGWIEDNYFKYTRKRIPIRKKADGAWLADEIGELPVLKTIDGYTDEVEWYTNSAYSGEPVDSTFRPTADTSLYPRRIGKIYKITFYQNNPGGVDNEGPEMIDKMFGTDYDLANAKKFYTINGYKLLGWSEDSNVTEATYAVDGKLTDIATVEELEASDNVVKNLYAVWSVESYTIRLNYYDNYPNIANEYPSVRLTGTTSWEIAYNTAQLRSENKFGYFDEIDLPMIKSMEESYVIIAWNTQSDGNGVNIALDENGAVVLPEGAKLTPKYLSGKNSQDIILYAMWALPYTITFDPEGAEEFNYKTSLEQVEDGGYMYEYTNISEFNLPDETEIARTGYSVKWVVAEADEEAISTWGDLGAEFKTGASISGKSGNVTLKAIWDENKYNIVIHSNFGKTTTIENVYYTAKVQITKLDGENRTIEVMHSDESKSSSTNIDWSLEDLNYVFIGWAEYNYGTNARYTDIFNRHSNVDISGEFGNLILQDGKNVSKLADTDGETIHIYAIWLPIYTLTIQANEGVVYKDGIVQNVDSFEVENHYLNELKLYSQDNGAVFNAPTGSANYNGYGLHKYGYSISGWKIEVGAVQYYCSSEQDDSPVNWIQATDTVASGTNMQYLQGNITATPIWEAFTFDVRYVTASNEEYKTDYNENQDIVSQVTFNGKYIISTSNIVLTGMAKVGATDISGYTPIYAHPYNKNNKISTDTTITLDGTWDYTLEYKQYTHTDTYDKNDGWYIEIEGYYSPDLYRLKLNLNLPYNDNDFKLNSNGYTLNESVGLGDLQKVYAPKIISTEGYSDSTNYNDRQHKIYKVGGDYYIYLLQDQIIKDGKVYNRYNNGKTIKNPTSAEGVLLPNFEINYYQMQFYYTFSNLSVVNLYQMADIDNDHRTYAEEQLTKSGASEINNETNWNYSYCDTNEDTNNGNFVLNVYWYRNIVNIEVNNFINNTHSFNGYTIVEEVEQVTGTLNGHNKYSLIVYSSENEEFKYVCYRFDDLSILGTLSNCNYAGLLENVETYINNNTLTKKDTNTIEIYFGNTFKVYAVDQSKDHSKDEFIGYRFDNYSYDISQSNITGLSEFDNYVNDYQNYTVGVNLQNYEQGNSENYLLDKDVITINVNFAPITYTLTYKVTDNAYTVVAKYGTIKLLNGQDIEDYQFTYDVNVNQEINATMQVRLGTELLRWDIVGNATRQGVQNKNGDGTDTQSCTITINAELLRDILYNSGAYSVEPTQDLADVNAVCQDIAFKINVNVKDLSQDAVIRTYTLSNSTDNPLFTIQPSTTTVKIDNEYGVKMLSKRASDEYVYYYQDGIQYVVRGLYIDYSLAHSTHQLVTNFDYPLTSLGTIALNVNHSLLDYTINYSQYIEVSEENRYLNFYVEITPTIEIVFKLSSNVNNLTKEDRQIIIEDLVIASATGNQQLNLVRNSYLGYWGQSVKFAFNADNKYYSKAQLSVNYNDEAILDTQYGLTVNSNIQYNVIGKSEITIDLVSRTYKVNAYIEYNQVRYSTTEDYGPNGELPITELKTASGTQILTRVTITPGEKNIDRTKPIYYYDDTLNISYTLNNDIKNDFEVAIYVNGNTLFKTDIVQFSDRDIEIIIAVRAKTNNVTLTTNMTAYDVGIIYAQINNGELQLLPNRSNLILQLVSGDKVTVYINPEVGFKFLNSYKDGLDNTFKIPNSEITEDGEYIKFTMFKAGFNLNQNGWYYLMFEQIPLNIQFKYYSISPSVEEVEAGEGYTSNSDTNIIQLGSTITLSKGTDNTGYRFEAYSYGGPLGEGVNLELTTLNETQQSFVITKEIMESSTYIDGELVLTIYANYVSQYTFTFNYLCRPADVIEYVTNDLGESLTAGVYYDYGTELDISVATKDTKHYKIKVTISVGGEEQIISPNSAGVVADEVVLTNKGNMSKGLKLVRNLTNYYVINLSIEVETYDTIINQNLYHGENQEIEPKSIGVMDKGSDLFNLGDDIYYKNIYYKVEGTHEYKTDVKITIYVINPPDVRDDEQNYYALSTVKLNGRDLTPNKVAESVAIDGLDDKTATQYEITYSLEGDDLPIVQDLEILFNVLYYVNFAYAN